MERHWERGRSSWLVKTHQIGEAETTLAAILIFWKLHFDNPDWVEIIRTSWVWNLDNDGLPCLRFDIMCETFTTVDSSRTLLLLWAFFSQMTLHAVVSTGRRVTYMKMMGCSLTRWYPFSLIWLSWKQPKAYNYSLILIEEVQRWRNNNVPLSEMFSRIPFSLDMGKITREILLNVNLFRDIQSYKAAVLTLIYGDLAILIFRHASILRYIKL